MSGSSTSGDIPHGGRVLQAARALGRNPGDILDFSNNLNPLVHDLTREIAACIPIDHAHHPDPDCRDLRWAVAEHEGLNPEQVLVGNGSSELIHALLAALAPKRVLLISPIYGEYGRFLRVRGIPTYIYALSEANGFCLTRADLDTLCKGPARDCDLAVLCSPNNPTGAALPDPTALLAALPCERVLVDAAYVEFLHGSGRYDAARFAALEQTAGPNRLVFIQSMTKYFFCPGVRLGYALADPAILDAARDCMPPWTVHGHAQAMGRALLKDIDAYREKTAPLPELREDFRLELEKTGLFDRIFSSDVNFVLCRLKPSIQARALADFLFQQAVLVRVCDQGQGLDDRYLRFQVMDRPGRERLLAGLRDFAANNVG